MNEAAPRGAATRRIGRTSAPRRAALAAAALLALLLPGAGAAATFTVNSTVDAVDANAGDGVCNTAGNACTLRAAIQQANALGGAHTINVPAGTYPITAALGGLTVSNAAADLAIAGTGPAGTVIVDGQNSATLFRLQGGTVGLANLVIRNAAVTLTDPGIFGACIGPALLVSGDATTVNVTASVLQDNSATNGTGGAVCVSSGTLNLDRSTVRDNTATYGGGGIRLFPGTGMLNITNSTISGNVVTNANGSGGGIETQGITNIANSTLSGNTAPSTGGALAVHGGTTTVTNVTIAGNGNAPQISVFGAGVTAAIESTIVADPKGGANCSAFSGGTIASSGHNLDSAGSCGFSAAGDLANGNPLLGPLVANGGATLTHALLAGSPAIDAGSNPLALATDQRGAGFLRVQGAAADIGAYEVNAGSPPALQAAAARKAHPGAGAFDLPLSLSLTNPTTEPRQGPALTLMLAFDKAITGALVTVADGAATAGAPVISDNVASVDLTGIADLQYVTLAVTGVTAADGGTGGNASVRIGFLAGDANQNRAVTLADVFAVNAALAQPANPATFLRDVNVSGSVTLADILFVNARLTQVLPSPGLPPFTVGGTLSGLSGTVVLRNNGGNDLTLSANGGFAFSGALASGSGYAVTVLTQPAGQTCTVTNGTGTVALANVTDVGVSCAGTTSTGAEFHLAFPDHRCVSDPAACGGIPVTHKLVVASATATTGRVEFNGATTPFSVPAGGQTAITLDPAVVLTANESVEAKGIRVTSLDPVSVVAVSESQFSAQGSLVLPTASLGTDHFVVARADADPAFPGSEFAIVATRNNTKVTITPAAAGATKPANAPFEVTLNAGQTYQLQNPATGDLSGSRVTADQPIAVFGGHRCVTVPAGVFFCDHVVDQIPDVTRLGTIFRAVPHHGRSRHSLRIVGTVDATTLACSPAHAGCGTIDAGQVVDLEVTGNQEIVASAPVLVAQFSHGAMDEAVPALQAGDPGMAVVTPEEQALTATTFAVPGLPGTAGAWVNVVTPTAALGSLTLDGAPVNPALFSAIGASAYSGAALAVAPGAHALQGAAPFTAMVYDFGVPADAVGYAYPAATGLAIINP